MRRVFIAFFLLMSVSCSYQWGYRGRAVPGGYKQVAIPIFKNRTPQVGLETDFTDSLVREFERSQVARVTSKSLAPVRIDGVIEKLEIINGAGIAGPAATPNAVPTSTPANPLPSDAVLITQYSLKVRLKLQVRRQSDEKVLWEGAFEDQMNYQAPRIGEPIVNSADATYNESARRQTLSALADEMMSDAHDRMTENF